MIFFIEITTKDVSLDNLIKNGLKNQYKSFEYLQGFCDGYLFNNYRILTPDDVAKRNNNKINPFANSYLYVVSVDAAVPADN